MGYKIREGTTEPIALFLGLALVSMLPVSGQAAPFSEQVLGPGDQVVVRALHATEISDRPIRIDDSGYIRLPLAGRVMAGGRTVDQLAVDIRSRLEPLIRDPQVSIDVVEMKSQPVSVLGALKHPGVYQIQGRKRLLEVLSLAGGIDSDAGYSIRISRHKSMGGIPLKPELIRDSSDFSIAEVSLTELIEARSPEHNIFILPQDVVTIPRAKLVYVIGEVRKAGGFVLKEHQSMSVLQALSLAEGLTQFAKSGSAKIVRAGKSGERVEVAVDIKKILSGRVPDVPLLSDDVLVVPKSGAKSVAMRSVDAAINLGTGAIIWR